MDEALAEKVARAMYERRAWFLDDPRAWESLEPMVKKSFIEMASTAVQVLTENGWTPPPPEKD